MKRRRGRPRKPGNRYRSGGLKPERESPKAIAASQPHRRGLGDRALDQLAESELGRMQLRGTLEPFQVAAGQEYARLWRGYVSTLDGPRRPSGGHTGVLDCGGCLGLSETDFCMCALRKRKWQGAYGALREAGLRPWIASTTVALQDGACLPDWLEALRVGLSALAAHFGLTTNRKSDLVNASSKSCETSPPAER